MKKVLLSLLLVFAVLPLALKAQEVQSEMPDSAKHLMFHNIPMQGTIEQFGNELKHHFQLKRMMGAERNWIFQGFVYGKECPFQVFYSKKTRTVSRIIVMPKNLEPRIWVDSLTNDYGEPVFMDLGYLWQRTEGSILMRIIEGYDPALIFIDQQGQATFMEEEKKRK